MRSAYMLINCLAHPEVYIAPTCEKKHTCWIKASSRQSIQLGNFSSVRKDKLNWTWTLYPKNRSLCGQCVLVENVINDFWETFLKVIFRYTVVLNNCQTDVAMDRPNKVYLYIKSCSICRWKPGLNKIHIANKSCAKSGLWLQNGSI